ncbi:MAG: OmpH family outer membrane protein [Rikenellaceae bacterium]
MKKIFIAASLAFIFASCTAPTSNSNTSTVVTERVVTSASIVYVDVDRVLVDSDIYQKEGIPLQQRTEAAQRDWVQKEQKLQSEATQLQQKYQNGLITTANAQKEQQSIESRVEAFQKATQKQAQELDEENTVFANRAQTLIRSSIKNVNADGRYSMILTASSLIDADSTLNISSIVLAELNKLYANEKK